MTVTAKCGGKNNGNMYLKLKDLAFVIFWLAAALLAGGQVVAQDTLYQLPQRGLCAHRGVMDTHPENTIPSLQEAIRLGAQMIEFDVQLTKDSVLVLMHDKSVDRTTTGNGKVADLTLAQIKQLDAGIKKGARFRGTQVPTFLEVLSMMPRNVWLNCHLKGDAALGAAATRMLQQTGRMQQAFLTCGEEAAEAAKAAVPTVFICNGENRYRLDGPRYTEATLAMKAAFIQFLPPREGEARMELIQKLKGKGVRINYYHASSPEQIGPLFDIGVDFILVNDLKRFQQAAAEKGVTPLVPQF
jgi:glycerophosphoryl diester phosphodiesterase